MQTNHQQRGSQKPNTKSQKPNVKLKARQRKERKLTVTSSFGPVTSVKLALDFVDLLVVCHCPSITCTCAPFCAVTVALNECVLPEK